MIDSVVDFVHGAMASPWIYLLIAALAMADGFFPIVPGETLVIAAGVFAASGSPNLPLAVVAATVGAFAGDHISYAIGRTAGARILGRVPAGSRRRAAVDWATRALSERGGPILIVARYVPGGRTMTTMTAGAVRYPLTRFAVYVSLAAASWSTYSVLLGYLGGTTFRAEPLNGLLLGLGLAVATAVAVEAGRMVVHRRIQAARARRAEQSDPIDTTERERPDLDSSSGPDPRPLQPSIPSQAQAGVASETPKSPDGSVHQDSLRSPASASSAST